MSSELFAPTKVGKILFVYTKTHLAYMKNSRDKPAEKVFFLNIQLWM